MDLLSPEDKQSIHQLFDNLHDTFAREIEIFLVEDEALINIENNFNPIYGVTDPSIARPETKIYKKKARIKYVGDQEKIYGLGLNSQLNVSFSKGEIRLKVDKETYDIITKAKKIKVDDRLCELISSPARIGPFNPNYWSIHLKQID